MKVFQQNKIFRLLTMSNFLNKMGSSIYNLVFVAFAAAMPHSKFYVGLANIIVFIPVLFTFFIGIWADETKEKSKWLISLGFVQAAMFFLVAALTSNKTWFAFSIVCLMNICSDMISDYRSGLQMHIFQENVAEEDLFEAHSMNQVLSYTCNLAGQALGIWILTSSQENFALIASINALSFLLSSLILLKGKTSLTYPPAQVDDSSMLEKIKEVYRSLNEIFTESESVDFNRILLLILFINALGSAFTSIYNMHFLQHGLWNLSFGQSILVIQIIVICSSILGSLFSKDYFSKQSLTTILLWDSVVLTVIAGNNALGGSQILSLSGLAFIFYLAGKINPKLNTLLMSALPSEILARSGNFLSLLFMLAMPLGSTIFTIISYFSLSISWYIFAFGTLILVWMTIGLQRKNAKTEE